MTDIGSRQVEVVILLKNPVDLLCRGMAGIVEDLSPLFM